jgi:hypothetical protein
VIFGKIVMMRDTLQLKTGETVLNDSDFICVTCILCFGTLENLNRS